MGEDEKGGVWPQPLILRVGGGEAAALTSGQRGLNTQIRSVHTVHCTVLLSVHLQCRFASTYISCMYPGTPHVHSAVIIQRNLVILLRYCIVIIIIIIKLFLIILKIEG